MSEFTSVDLDAESLKQRNRIMSKRISAAPSVSDMTSVDLDIESLKQRNAIGKRVSLD